MQLHSTKSRLHAQHALHNDCSFKIKCIVLRPKLIYLSVVCVYTVCVSIYAAYIRYKLFIK
jgi:hypothetical protein